MIDDSTPVELALRRPESPEARALYGLACALSDLALDITEVARHFDGSESDARDGILDGVARKLAEAGDLMHDARRAVTGMKHGNGRKAT